MNHTFIRAKDIKDGDLVIWAFDGIPGCDGTPGKNATLAAVKVSKVSNEAIKGRTLVSGIRLFEGGKESPERTYQLDNNATVFVVEAR